MARARRRRATFENDAAPAMPPRIDGVDALRGIAIVAMIAYHFAFDLRFFGVIDADFEHGRFWLTARALIVTSFLLLVGTSLVLAERTGVPPRRHFRRVAVIALCALAASVASYAVDPRSYIHFGILHCIVAAVLIGRPLARHPRLAAIAGIAVVLAGLALSHPFFDTRATSWIGFATAKPRTVDYVPLFPWLGVALIGIALGDVLARASFAPLARLARAPAALRALGRHSLLVYMAHQPLLMGALWLLLRRG
jgi:uncharacterized membrane protein